MRFIMTILWAALIASVGIHVLAAYLATQGQPAVAIAEPVWVVMSLCAAGAAVASLLVPRWSPSNERILRVMRKDIDLRELATNPQSRILDESRLEGLRSLSEHEQRLVGLTRMYFTPFILGMALSEAVAIFGLVLAILGRSPENMLPFAAAAILLMVTKYPNFNSLFERAERVHRGRR